MMLPIITGKDDILAFTGRCCRGYLHILAENSLESFISVYHGTKHERLSGGKKGGGKPKEVQ